MARNLQRDHLRKLQQKSDNRLIPLRIEYSVISKLLTGYIKPLMNLERVYPTHLPTQKNYRWSTLNPPLTNLPRACINPQCQIDRRKELEQLGVKNIQTLMELFKEDHELTPQCWSLRDCFLADEDEITIKWDHDNIEGRIGAILLNDKLDLEAFEKNYDLHTINCCMLFNYDLPPNLINPHTSEECAGWREKYKWQGKETTQRVLSKNFYHGGRYAPDYKYVRTIKNIEKFGVTYKELERLAKRYIEIHTEAHKTKLEWIAHVRRTKEARTLYGARRLFYTSDIESGKEGFNHMISGTVSHYNNGTLISLEERFGQNIRLIHNAHDGNTIAIKKGILIDKKELSSLIERPISYQNRSITLSAGIKIYE